MLIIVNKKINFKPLLKNLLHKFKKFLVSLSITKYSLSLKTDTQNIFLYITKMFVFIKKILSQRKNPILVIFIFIFT